MADEIVIYEMARVAQQAGTSVSALYSPTTTQYVDVGSLSSSFGSSTVMVRIKNISAASVYYALGDSSASATAVTAGSLVLAAGDYEDIELARGNTHIDTAS